MNNQFTRSGILFVISAPSGAGKTTLCQALRKTEDFVYSISCTTRSPRSGEIDGKDYYFLSESEFLARVKAGDFIEQAQVHGNYYGTLRKTLVDNLDDGKDVLIDVDTQGAAAIRMSTDPTIQKALCDVFIMPPNLEELRDRLRKRGTESAQQIEVRIATAMREVGLWSDYRYTIVTKSTDEDLRNFRTILEAERHLSKRLILT